MPRKNGPSGFMKALGVLWSGFETLFLGFGFGVIYSMPVLLLFALHLFVVGNENLHVYEGAVRWAAVAVGIVMILVFLYKMGKAQSLVKAVAYATAIYLVVAYLMLINWHSTLFNLLYEVAKLYNMTRPPPPL
ncbi:hypothetical protein ODS41_09930 [Pyrobaculum sp. 3827-6]|uniref:hypothetical protein n=1 Tax=Pyrobaculum sp. 3827-6 TaxID=2983604 RepID=UPI0021D94928|nr:hypothetical protein [Pyrobaculum sp. 3827-6]MCU7788228.1 hypothetical protein [Pyrobaculum sp. 3827-6]